MIQKIDLNTRKILHKVHLNRIKKIKKGLKGLVITLIQKPSKLKRIFFKGKICGEFGAGSHGGGGLNVLKLGAGFVHLLDVNKNIKSGINKNLKKFKGKYKIHIGSVDNLPFKNNYFDFINCSGVLHHIEKPKKAFREIKRVLKKWNGFNSYSWKRGDYYKNYYGDIAR